MPATPQDQWYHFWPDWPTGTLRVDLIGFEQICYCFVRSRALCYSVNTSNNLLNLKQT